MSNPRLFFLFQLHVSQQLNAEEKAEFLHLLTDLDNEEEAKELLGEAWEDFETEKLVFTNLQRKNMLQQIFAAPKNELHSTEKRINWQRIFAVAAILLLISSVGVLLLPQGVKNDKPKIVAVKLKKQEVKPDVEAGGNKAILTLADGTKIILDDKSTGKIANQSGVNISKTADGQLVYAFGREYKSTANSHDAAQQINTISTPKGGQYQINLPDGSKVWLNAMSSLKFPTQFLAKERKVELVGEAYFEISPFYAGKIKLPFKVISPTADGSSQEVEVLGTHFNINAYGNEMSTKTTLLEGSVKVINLHSKTESILQPGQQAVLKGNQTYVKTVDKEEIMAWKNGDFLFNNLQLVDIMKQLERWYAIRVDYSTLPNTRYQGVISKHVSLSQVLNMLELTGSLKFKIDSIAGSTEKKIEIWKDKAL